VVAVIPAEVDLRMLVQHSQFTIHGNRKNIAEMEKHDDYLVKFEIPAPAKRRIAQELDLLAVRRSHLFPDLENLAAEIAGYTFDT
jgi:hypothetical protein